VINNPFWWPRTTSFLDNGCDLERRGGAQTVLLPHKGAPAQHNVQVVRNIEIRGWDEVFRYLGFPVFLKPAYGGGWKDVYGARTRRSSLPRTIDARLVHDGQEAIEFTEYYRCYVLGRSKVHVMRYDPQQPTTFATSPGMPPPEATLHAE